MPFTLKVIGTERRDGELVLRGHLVEGAYFGPEQILLRTLDGREYPSYIHTHGMEFPEDWPVLPEHRNTVLILTVQTPPEEVAPPEIEIAVVKGVGAVEQAARRVDISAALDEKEFWASELDLHFTSEDVDDPGFEWLGVPPEASNEWYKTRIQQPILEGVWPYVRVELPSSRYIELEFAGGVQYQDRVWIGDGAGTRRVLLGYHSGHFSLPALRVEEVSWLARATDSAASNLLWLATAYVQEGVESLAFATRLASRLPGILPDNAGAAAAALIDNLTFERLKWVEDGKLGWINNSSYSQRNPKSKLSVLKQADFTYIREFFS